jgi:hypothetical protein
MQSLSPTRQRGVSRPPRVRREQPHFLAHAVSTAAAPHVMTLAPAGRKPFLLSTKVPPITAMK